MSNSNKTAPPANERQGSNDSDDQVFEQIIYTTSDGFDIPPEWETSCLMALEVQRLTELDTAKKAEKMKKAQQQNETGNTNTNNNDDEDDDSSATATSREPSSPQQANVVTDFAALFKDHDAQVQRQHDKEMREQEEDDEEEDTDSNATATTTSTTAISEHQGSSSASSPTQTKHGIKTQQTENDDDEDDDDETWVDEDNMIDGMLHSTSALGMEREETDQSQWKLEEIILRRSVPVHYDDIDADVEDDDPRAVGHSPTSKQKAKKEFSYLCKWAPGGHCTTWELRSLLVEEGFGPQVDAYDLKIKDKGIRDKKERLDEYKGPCEFGKIAARRPRRSNKAEKLYEEEAGGVPAHQAFFERLLPQWEEDLSRFYTKGGLVIERLVRIAPKKPANDFITHLRYFSQGRAADAPPPVQITFHGTSTAGITGIMRNGLIIPGKLGVSVANGTAYGCKIYSGATPPISVSYDRTGLRLMFACVGIPTEKNIHGDFVCFDEERKVCPVWLIQYQQKSQAQYNSYQVAPGHKFELCDTEYDFFKKVNFNMDSATRDGVTAGSANNGTAPAPGQKLTAHQKKLIRQTRQQLGLEKISI